MKNTLKLFGIAVITAVIGFSLVTCNSPAGDPTLGNTDGDGNETGPVRYVMDISETATGWDLLVFCEDGSSMVLKLDETTLMPTRAYIKPQKDSDNGFSIWFKTNGLPDLMVTNDHIVCYGNFDGYTFDMVVIKPNGDIEEHNNNQTDVNWDTFNEVLFQENSGNARSVFDLLRGGKNVKGEEIPFTLANVLDCIGTGAGLAACITAPLIPGAAIGCGIFLFSQVTGEVVQIATKDNDLASDIGGTLISALGCVTLDPWDCASTAVGLWSLIDDNAAKVLDKGFELLNKGLEATLGKMIEKKNYVPVTGIKLDKTAITLTADGFERLTATVLPSNATRGYSVTWSSSKENVAEVIGGVWIDAKKEGTAVLTVKTVEGNFKATCTVTVLPPVAVTGVTLDKTTLSLAVNGNERLTATVLPSNAADKSVTWSSSNENVATVTDHGWVTARAEGEATITVKTSSGYTQYTATCTVTVLPPVAVTGVTLDKTTLSLAIGEDESLTATVLPSNAKDKSVTWSSSNENVARVSTYGLVKAVAEGEATITVKTSSGYTQYTATCVVTVTGSGDISAQWAKTVSAGTNSSCFDAVARDQLGNVYAAGYQSGTGTFNYGNGVTAKGTSNNYNVVLVKYNASGTAQWAKTVSAGTDSSYFNAVACDQSGNVYAAGYQVGTGTFNYGNGVTAKGTNSTTSSEANGSNVVLVKYDASGNAQWARTAAGTTGTSQPSQFKAVACDQSGNVYAAGYQHRTVTYGTGVSASGVSTTNVVLVKYDASGNAQWAKTTSAGETSSRFTAVACDQSGNVYAAGYQYGSFNTLTYGTDVTSYGINEAGGTVVLVKYDASGTAQWARSVNGPRNMGSAFTAVACDQSGNVYAGGYQDSGTDTFTYGTGVTAKGAYANHLGLGSNVVLVKYDASGTAQWARTVSTGNDASSLAAVACDQSGNVYAAGYQMGTGTFTYGIVGTGVSVTGTASRNNYVLVKYNASGNTQWAKMFGRNDSGDSPVVRAVTCDQSGNVYAAGYQSKIVTYTFGPGVSATGTYSGGDNALLVKYK